MHQTLAKKLLIHPVHALRGERVWEYLEEVRKVESLSRDGVEAFQQKKLLSLLENAGRHSEYYARLFRSLWGSPSVPGEVYAGFRQIPFLTKEAVQQAYSHPLSAGSRLDCRTTSGSTGVPLRFYKDRVATAYMEAVQLSAYGWHGVGVGAAQARFWGMPQGVRGEAISRLKDFLKNRIRLSAFNLDHGFKLAFYERLMRFRPTYFYGYPSLILEFGRFIREQRLDISRVPLKVIFGTGEYIYPDEKSELQDIFGVPFVSEYGCSETGVIGFDCPHGRMHVMAPNILLEVLKEDRPVLDEEGDICVTELNSNHFPFIRYKIGDRGKLLSDPCPCGLQWPVLEVLAGRRDDYVITPEGGKVYDAIFAYTLKEGIDSFKAIQEEPGSVVVYLVKNAAFDERKQKKYLAKLEDLLGGSVKVRFEYKEAIERTPAGKFRYFERRF